MPLVSGARLGPYEIVGALGAGGMGEVYKARDTRLDRIVAVKVLSDQLAADPQFKARFDLEARAISQLAHPNICTLHDVGEDHGVSYLVMEYLEGETLADRIARGPLPVDDALPVAMQMASALDRAHRASIVHRDLKPGNIFLTRAGAKLLDFGLAKSTATLITGTLSALPTTPPAAITAQGAILGTFQYMAPEQIEGLEADVRTDIFAFGAVLYEMLTGRRAFDGKSQATLIGSIMASQPAPPSAITPATPPALDRLVRTCLTKDPNDRYQSAHDVLLLLQSIGELSAAQPASQRPARVRRWGLLAAGVAALAVTAAAASMITTAALRPEPATPVRFAMTSPTSEEFTTNPVGNNVTISPDGRLIVYHVSRGSTISLYVRPIDQVGARLLIDDAFAPVFSPDSAWIGFYDFRTLTWKKMPAGGGPSTPIAPATSLGDGTSWGSASWGDDGTIVFTENGNAGVFRVPAAGGKPEILVAPQREKDETDLRSPSMLPGGRGVLFDAFHGANPSAAEICVFDLRTKKRKTLIQGGFAARYVASGHLVFARPNAIMAVPFDLERLELRGTPMPVQEGVGTKTNGVSNFAISNNGTLVYAPSGGSALKGRPIWVGRDSRELGSLTATDLDSPAFPRVSPDGRRLALIVAGNVWVYDLNGRPPIKLTFDGDGSSFTPLWTPDGAGIVYESVKGGLAVVRADGSTSTAAIASPAGHFHPAGWLAGGREVVATQLGTPTLTDVVMFVPDAKAEVVPVVRTQAVEGFQGVSVSPDGKLIAYTSDVTGRTEVWVRPYPGPGAPLPVSANGGAEPQWSRDGRELYFIGDRDTIMMAAINPGPQLSFKPPVTLFQTSFMRAGQPPSYDVTPDGRFVFVRRGENRSAETNLIVELNWLEELKRRVPTN